MGHIPSLSYSITLRLEVSNRIGMFAKVATLIAASEAIAESIDKEELNEDYIIPSLFDTTVAKRVAMLYLVQRSRPTPRQKLISDVTCV
jgi:hypothetical protein